MKIFSLHHLGLSVKSLEETAGFFTNYLEFTAIKEVPSYWTIFASNGQILESAIEFDRKENTSLHHCALKTASEALIELNEKVEAYPNVKTQFAPENPEDVPFNHFMIYEPGGIRMTLIWPTLAEVK